MMEQEYIENYVMQFTKGQQLLLSSFISIPFQPYSDKDV